MAMARSTADLASVGKALLRKAATEKCWKGSDQRPLGATRNKLRTRPSLLVSPETFPDQQGIYIVGIELVEATAMS